MKNIKYIVLALSIGVFTACTDFFDPDTDDVLKEDQYVGEKGELYSGYMGLAACVQAVADQASFIEGLRGDLLEPTVNASSEIWAVYNYDDLSTNSFVDPKGYYNVIVNANDYIEHVFEYWEANPSVLTESAYQGLIGGAIRYKVWAYLMLAKIYGEAIYFDDPLISYVDISKFPTLNFDQVIEKCRELMEVGVKGVDGSGSIQWSSELFPTQGASPTSLGWDRITPPAECLLAEIYLYQKEYQKAKDNCIKLITQGGAEASYQVNLSEYNGEWKQFGYEFMRKEHIAVAYFDFSYAQTNRYIEYYSNTYPNKYYLMPSEVARKRFESQYNSGGILNDQYRGRGVTYKQVNGSWVLQKFLTGHESADKIYRNDVLISLYRAGEIHLFLVEALIGLGQFEQALAFLNDGIGAYYDVNTGKFLAPFEEYPATLYVTSSTGDKSNRGIRGRVNLGKVGTFALTSSSPMDTLRSMYRLDSLVVEETCLELAGEAKAYFAMNRIGRKWSADASKSWASEWIQKASNEGDVPNELWSGAARAAWASKVGAKYTNGKGETITGQLAAGADSWFINFDLKN